MGLHKEFNAVYASNAQMVYWTAYGITHHQETAADITQSTFLKAFEHWEKLQGLLAPQQRSWLCQTCRNFSITFIRKDKRAPVPLDTVSALLPTADSSPEDQAEAHALTELVWQQVRSLPVLYRDPILLHYFAQLSTQEGARILRIPGGTYRSRLARARKLLEQSFSNEVNQYE